MSFPLIDKEREEEEVEEKTYKKYDQLILTLPEYTIKHVASSSSPSVMQVLRHRQYRHYQGFWFEPDLVLPGVMAAQDRFVPRPSDILICTPLKVGTTWLKALASFATLNRNDQPGKQSLLLSHNPHHCVLNLEFNLYGSNRMTDLTVGTSPRLLSTHIPCQLFPTSWLSSGCKFVYLCRNPKDTFISYWHFVNNIMKDVNYKVPLGDAFDAFLKGVHLAGPLWDHVFGFWNASLVNPDKVLFMKYEELKSDTAVNLKKLAEFMGCPFTEEEERDGVLEKILDMCSFESLRNLKVNKTGTATTDISLKFGNDAYFRKGEVGDWVNFLTPEMAERLDQAMEEKLKGSGLSFEA